LTASRKTAGEAGSSFVVEDVDEEASGAQIDAAVVGVGCCMFATHAYLATGRHDPASWLPGERVA
jgi:hypothetical protein